MRERQALQRVVAVAALAVELGVTPPLCLWQARVAAEGARTENEG